MAVDKKEMKTLKAIGAILLYIVGEILWGEDVKMHERKNFWQVIKGKE